MLNAHKMNSIYLACGVTDLRKSIDGLTVVVLERFKLDPFGEHLFVFCNRQKNKIKILHWEKNGFWLYYRRLEKGTIRWPEEDAEMDHINRKEFTWMMDGLALIQYQKRHKEITARIAY